MNTIRDAFKRYGPIGFAARAWSRTFGLFIDVDVFYTLRVGTAIDFTPIPGYRYERARPGSPHFEEAMALLGVDPAKCANREAFVAVSEDGRVAACAFNDRVAGTLASVRGTAVAPAHRGRSLGGNLMRFQAQQVAADGASEIDSHVALTNRASQHMLAGMHARRVERWIFLVFLRRFRLSFKREY
jgi:GNAT superfamily N-acetyltransferase